MTTAADDAVERTTGRPRDPDVDRRAIEAVLSLYSDFGLAGISFEKVARQASVGKAGLYSRWASVEELLIDALRMIAPLPVEVDTGSLRSDLRQLVLMLLDLYTGPHGRVSIRINLDAAVHPGLQTLYSQFIAAYARASRAVVSRGIDQGELDEGTDPALLLEQLFGTTMFHVLFFGPAGRAMSFSAASSFADNLVDNVLGGVTKDVKVAE